MLCAAWCSQTSLTQVTALSATSRQGPAAPRAWVGQCYPPNVRPDAQGALPLSAVGQACMSPPCEVTARGRQASESRDVDRLVFGLFLTSRRPQPRWPLRGLLPVCAF